MENGDRRDHDDDKLGQEVISAISAGGEVIGCSRKQSPSAHDTNASVFGDVGDERKIAEDRENLGESIDVADEACADRCSEAYGNCREVTFRASKVDFRGSEMPQTEDNDNQDKKVFIEREIKTFGTTDQRNEMKDIFIDNMSQRISDPVDVSRSSSSENGSPGTQSPPGDTSPTETLGRVAAALRSSPSTTPPLRVNGTFSRPPSQQIEDSSSLESEKYDETREKLQMIRVKFLRLSRRLGQTPHNVVVAQVLYRLGLAEQLRGRNGGRVGASSFDRASALAEQLGSSGHEPLDFTCTILVLGKTGVGKSATINSLLDEVKFPTDAFQMSTKKVQDVVGTVQGIKVRVIDTPGLLASWSDQRYNEKILHSVKRFIKKNPPDIILYLDRLDSQSSNFSDVPLLRTITQIFSSSIWFNAIVVLTHAASAPPDGPNGTASSYEMFVTQRSQAVQLAIRQAADDVRLLNPISLVENHSSCRTNRAGQRVLPNGQIWKPHLLLLSFASKILTEANALLNLQDSPTGTPFAPRSRAPPMHVFLSSLLQSRLLPPDEDYDDHIDYSDEESEYDSLPPFQTLTNEQLSKLSKAQRKSYYEELEHREKLLMKKQINEERRRRKMVNETEPEELTETSSSMPTLVSDLAIPESFDSDSPTHRYRTPQSMSRWVVRPVLETHGWDHDVGYEGLMVERIFNVKESIPVTVSGLLTKDKKEMNGQVEVSGVIKHGGGKATWAGVEMQAAGKETAYTVRGETRVMNGRRNKVTGGALVTVAGDTVAGGAKVEDRVVVSERVEVVVTGGVMTGRGDVAYGGSVEAQVREGEDAVAMVGASVIDWHGEVAVALNAQGHLNLGSWGTFIGRCNVNNKGSGQISLRLPSHHIQLAFIGIIPFLAKLFSSQT